MISPVSFDPLLSRSTAPGRTSPIGDGRLSLFAIDLTFPVFVSEYKTALRQFPNLKTNAVEAFTILEENPRFGDAIPGFDQAL
jgi:hypothetical protein